jgi:hypothetical protein
VKPLRDRGFPGMLRRTMSHENDAFPPKDAASESRTEAAGAADHETNDAKRSADVEAKPVKTKSTKAKSDDSDDEKDSGADDEKDSEVDSEKDSDDGDDEKEKPRAARRQQHRRSSSSRGRSRDDDDDDLLSPPETEEAVNVPKMQTVYMLGAMSTLTVILWFAAKLACNIHPDQVRDPKHFSTKDLAADPKNAAFEFHHNFETGDYVTAYDLSTGDMKRTVEGKLKECEQTPDECQKNQRKQAGTIQSTGRLMTLAGNRATVELTSERTNVTAGPLKSYAFEVVKEGEFWRVASRKDIPTVAPQAPVQQPPSEQALQAAASGRAPAEQAPQGSSNTAAPAEAAPEQPAAPAQQ